MANVLGVVGDEAGKLVTTSGVPERVSFISGVRTASKKMYRGQSCFKLEWRVWKAVNSGTLSSVGMMGKGINWNWGHGRGRD